MSDPKTSVNDWSTTANSNDNINGINIAEGCAAANMNNMGREIMAQTKTKFDGLYVQLDGYRSGLTLANNATDATNDLDIGPGVATDDTEATIMVLSSTITKRLDAAWAVGTGAGGLDTGSIGDKTYFVWLIQRSDTLVVDVLLSASATAPTMPTNYDRKRRIGAIIRVGSTIRGFTQVGRTVIYTTSILDLTTTNPGGGSAISVNLTVPIGIRVLANVNVVSKDSAVAGSYLLVTSLAAASEVYSSSSNSSARSPTAGYECSFTGDVLTNTTGSIRVESLGSATNSLNVRTYGFTYLDW